MVTVTYPDTCGIRYFTQEHIVIATMHALYIYPTYSAWVDQKDATILKLDLFTWVKYVCSYMYHISRYFVVCIHTYVLIVISSTVDVRYTV